MSTLLHYLAQFSDNAQPRIHSYASHVHSTLTFKAVAKQAQAYRSQHSELGGARVAVTMTASSEVLAQLVALDGYADELVLLPVDYAVPSNCHFHINERSQLRKLQAPVSGALPIATQWRLLGENHKLVSFTLDELAANELVQRGRRDHPLRWGVMQEPAELAGLLVWIRALKHGEDIVLAQADSLKALAQMFTHAGVTAIAASPRLWRNFIASANVARLPLELVILNGAIVDEPTVQRLQNIFEGVQVAHAFSYTQVGVSWLVTDGELGLPADFFKVSEQGVRLSAGTNADANTALAARSGAGAAAGPSPAAKAGLDAGAARAGIGNRETDTKAALTINHGCLAIKCLRTGAEIPTNYLVEKREGGRVYINGQRDTMVIVGGREVYPEQVEAALLAVAGVLDVQAGSMPDPVLGELIRVDILAPGHRTVAARKGFKEALQAYCREHLEPWQRPARYYFHG